MAGADVLLTVAEIWGLFVGLSAIAVFLRQQRGFSPSQAFVVRVLIEVGLSGVLFALLPFVLALFGVAEAGVWRLSCSSWGFFIIVYCTAYLFRRRQFLGEWVSVLRPWVIYPVATISYSLGFVSVLAALGVGIFAGPGLYVLGLAWGLFVTGVGLLVAIRGE